MSPTKLFFHKNAAPLANGLLFCLIVATATDSKKFGTSTFLPTAWTRSIFKSQILQRTLPVNETGSNAKNLVSSALRVYCSFLYYRIDTAVTCSEFT